MYKNAVGDSLCTIFAICYSLTTPKTPGTWKKVWGPSHGNRNVCKACSKSCEADYECAVKWFYIPLNAASAFLVVLVSIVMLQLKPVHREQATRIRPKTVPHIVFQRDTAHNNASFVYYQLCTTSQHWSRWLSGRAPSSWSEGREFEPHLSRCNGEHWPA
jgi:hypothetical protein